RTGADKVLVPERQIGKSFHVAGAEGVKQQVAREGAHVGVLNRIGLVVEIVPMTMVRSSGVSILLINSGTSRSGRGNSGCFAICQPNSKSLDVYGLPSCHLRLGRSL